MVPLDGSALAERVLPYAIRLAAARQSRLIRMRAAIAPPPRTLDGSEWESDQTAAIAEAVDLIVMATHGRTGIQRAVFESVAGSFLRAGPTPVLLVHPHPRLLAEAGPQQVNASLVTF